MNRFMIDMYSGMQNRRTPTKSFSAYDYSSGTNKEAIVNSTLSEKEQAIEIAKKLKERMNKETPAKTDRRSLTQMANEAKEKAGIKNPPPSESTKLKNERAEMLKKAPEQSIEEIKHNVEIMKKLNEKVKEESMIGSPDQVLSSILSDLF